jgi:hypothetical protein
MEFEKYRIIQDRLYQNDFDNLVQKAEAAGLLVDENEKQNRICEVT